MSATLVELYGLKNCDGCRKARRWLADNAVECAFHDLREGDNARDALRLIEAEPDWTPFLNRRSTTWRKLPDSDKADLDRTRALRLLAAEPTLIKRPLLRIGNVTLAGFDAARVGVLVG